MLTDKELDALYSQIEKELSWKNETLPGTYYTEADRKRLYPTQEEIDAEPGVLERGIKGGGGYGNASLFAGAAGLAAKIVGAEDAAQGFYDKSQELAREGQELYPQKVNFDQMLDDPSLSNIGEWLGYNVAAAVPMMVASMGVGGLAGLTGRAALGTMAKKAGEEAVKKATASELAAIGAEKIAESAASDFLKTNAARIGTGAAAASMAPVEAGGLWIDDAQKHGVENTSPIQDALFGAGSAGLETLGVEASMLGRLLGKTAEPVLKETADTVLGRLGQRGMSALKEGSKQFVNEGILEEAGQEGIAMVNEALNAVPGETPDIVTDKGLKRLAESGIVGGVAGFAPGTMMGAFRHRTQEKVVPEVKGTTDILGQDGGFEYQNDATNPFVSHETGFGDTQNINQYQAQAPRNASGLIDLLDQEENGLSLSGLSGMNPQERQLEMLHQSRLNPSALDMLKQSYMADVVGGGFPSDVTQGAAAQSAGVFENNIRQTELGKLAGLLTNLSGAKQQAEDQAREAAIVQSPIGSQLLADRLRQEETATVVPEDVPVQPFPMQQIQPAFVPLPVEESEVSGIGGERMPEPEMLPQSVPVEVKKTLPVGSKIEWNDKKGNTLAGTITGIRGSRYEIERENPQPGQGKKTFLHTDYNVRAVDINRADEVLRKKPTEPTFTETKNKREKAADKLFAYAKSKGFNIDSPDASPAILAKSEIERILKPLGYNSIESIMSEPYPGHIDFVKNKNDHGLKYGDRAYTLIKKPPTQELIDSELEMVKPKETQEKTIQNDPFADVSDNDLHRMYQEATTKSGQDKIRTELMNRAASIRKPESNYDSVAEGQKEPDSLSDFMEQIENERASYVLKATLNTMENKSAWEQRPELKPYEDRIRQAITDRIDTLNAEYDEMDRELKLKRQSQKEATQKGTFPVADDKLTAVDEITERIKSIESQIERLESTGTSKNVVAWGNKHEKIKKLNERKDALRIKRAGLIKSSKAAPESQLEATETYSVIGKNADGRETLSEKVSIARYLLNSKSYDARKNDDDIRFNSRFINRQDAVTAIERAKVNGLDVSTPEKINQALQIRLADAQVLINGNQVNNEKFVGKNKRGNDVFEDKNGVRSYIEGGIKATEPVGVIPGGGMKISSNQERFDKLRHDYLTKEEIDTLSSKKTKTLEDNHELEKPSEGTLERVQADDVQGVAEGGKIERGVERSGKENTRGHERTGESGVSEPRSMGDGEGEIPVSSGRGRTDGRRGSERSGEVLHGVREGNEQDSSGGGRKLTPDEKPAGIHEKAGDFSISKDDAIGEGGAKTKFKNNIAAIKLLARINKENRPANKEEQKILAKYVGWGGIPQAFYRENGSVSAGWDKEAKELKETLPENEYLSARRSTQDAHYTSTEIVKSIWDAVKRLGFRKGRVLEPSVGVGNFIGLIPRELKAKTRVTGVELDPTTGGIAKLLYPNEDIHTATGFQDFNTPDNYFDIAVGNPPFGSTKLFDSRRKEISRFSIHNYFFAKSIDAIRPGGLLAMVVSSNFMDAANSDTRKYIAEKANLVAAWRLPNNAFLKNAGTEVTTDIIILQKRDSDTDPNGVDWIGISSVKDPEGRGDVPLNEYFVKKPGNMFGRFGLYGSMYRPDMPALVAVEGQNTAGLLAEAINSLPENIFKNTEKDPVKEVVIDPADITGVKVGSMFIKDGAVFLRGENVLNRPTYIERQIEGRAFERVSGMIGIRDAFTTLRRLQLSETAKDSEIDAARQRLNTLYDAFVKKNGFVLSEANKRLFREDPTWPQLAALEEQYDKGISRDVAKKTGEEPRQASAKKAAIFSKRTQYPYTKPTAAKNAKDALSISLSQKGDLDLEYMQSLYGKGEEEITRELKGLIFKTPAGEFQTREQYLNGNVKKKLAEAIEAAKTDPLFNDNIDALKAVQPADIEPVDINVKPGSHWIPASDIKAFISHISGTGDVEASYVPANAKWYISIKNTPESAETRWGTPSAYVGEIIAAVLNQGQITIKDRTDDGGSEINHEETAAANNKISLVKEEWNNWVWDDDDRRARLARIYNDNFNTDNLVPHDGSHLSFPGKVGDDIIKLRPHQANAVWRIMQDGKALLDHVVGAGKTFTMIAAAMEMRRTGISKKPLFVVPNHLVSQWAGDFVRLYPGAEILAASKKDFEKSNRKRLFERITTGDWDAVIIAHSSFVKMPVEPEFEARFLNEQLLDLEESISAMRETEGRNARSVKQQEKMRDNLKAKLQKVMDRTEKDDVVNFGELGVDSLFVDEAHEFKNLAYFTSLQRVGGVTSGQGSNKASDLYMKARQVMNSTGGKNVVFATGTPISNSMAEMFTIQRYLDYDNLKDQGLSHFDAWARMFGEVVTDWELSPAGKYQLRGRFSKFVNMPELLSKYRGFADVINREDIIRQLKERGQTLPVPKIKGGKPQNIITERSPEQAAYIGVPKIDPETQQEEYPVGSLVWRSEHLPKGKPQKGDDNMLVIMNDARKAALDMRLINPNAPDFAGSKVNTCARNIKELYDEWDKDKGAQLVFCDLSTPKKAVASAKAEYEKLLGLAENGDDEAIVKLDRMSPDDIDALNSQFSVYDDLKEKLVRLGIPSREIAFIHDANTDIQKEELFAKVRSGKIRVLVGSSSKMGAGMNVQERLVALHHLDAPWRPSDLEQREGRIIRQGNRLYEADPEGFEVSIMRYASEQTLDSRMWQIIETKARFIEQVRKGNLDSREIEDVEGEAANAAEMKAASSGNPLILEENDLRTKIKKLEDEKKNHDRSQHNIKQKISGNNRWAARRREKIKELESDMAVIPKFSEDFYLNGKKIDKRKEAGAKLLSEIRSYAETDMSDSRKVGRFGEFSIELEGGKSGAHEYLYVRLVREGVYGYEASFALDQKKDDVSEIDGSGLITRIENSLKRIPEDYDSALKAIRELEADMPKLEKQIQAWNKTGELARLKERHREVIDELKPKKEEGKEGQTENTSTQNTKKSQSLGVKINSFQDFTNLLVLTGGKGSLSTSDGIVTINQKAMGVAEIKIRGSEDAVGKYLEDGELLRLAGKDPSTEKKDVQLVMSNHRASRAFDYISKKDFFVTDNFHDQARLMLGMVTPEAVVSKVSEPSASFVNKGFPVYSLADKKEPAGIPADLISKEFSRLASRLPHEVVKSEKELPQGIREDISEKGFSGRAQALFDPESGKVFFVADNIGSIQAAQTGFLENLVRHEGRHAVISQMFESKGARNMFMDRASRLFKADVEKYLSDNGLENTKENVRTAAEEALVNQTVKGGVQAVIDEFLGKVVRWARRIFPNLSMTRAEARAFIRKADSGLEGEKISQKEGFSGKYDGEEGFEGAKFNLSDKVINKQIYSDAFKKWFGRSAVVEKNGRPLVVYKGMPTYDWRDGSSINIINSPNGKWAGFFTDSPSVANGFAEAFSFTNKQGVYPVYLKIENPFVVDADGKNASLFQFDKPSGNGNNQELINAINNNKYDGIIIKNTSDEGTVFVPKKPEQIKSATGNIGSFDPSNPDIRYSLKERNHPLKDLGITAEYSDIKTTDADGNTSVTGKKLVISGSFRARYDDLMSMIGGKYRFEKKSGAKGVAARNTYVFKNPSENIEQDIARVIKAFHGLKDMGLSARFREFETKDGKKEGRLYINGDNLHLMSESMKLVGGKLVNPQEPGKKPFVVIKNPDAEKAVKAAEAAKEAMDSLARIQKIAADKAGKTIDAVVKPKNESAKAAAGRIIEDIKSLFSESGIKLPSNNDDIVKGLHDIQVESDLAKSNEKFRKLFDIQKRYKAIATQKTTVDRESSKPYYDLSKKDRKPVDKVLLLEDSDRMEFSKDELVDRFGLNEKQIDGYYAIRNLYKKKLGEIVHDMLKVAVKDIYLDDGIIQQFLDAGSTDEIKKLLAENGVDSTMMKNLSWIADWITERKGYIPHKWDSEWLVRVNMPDGDVWLLDVPTVTGNILPTKALREGAANKAAVRVIKERIGWDDSQIKEWIDAGNILLVKSKEPPVDLFHGASLHAMSSIINSATDSAWEEYKDAFSTEQLMKQADLKEAIRKQMEELFLAKGAGQHFITRKNVKGFRTDIDNITGEYVGGMNSWLVKRDKAAAFTEAMKDIDPKKEPELFKHSRAFVDDMLGESQEAGWFKKVAGIWFLGADVSAAALNMFQNPTHAVPLMMRIKGDRSAYSDLAKAMKDCFKEWNESKKGGRFIFTGDSKYISKEEMGAIRNLYEQGFFDPAVVGEQTGFHPSSIWNNYADKTTKVLMSMFTGVEALNRSSTFLAAYRRAKAAGLASPIEVAKNITNEAHFQGGKENRPLLVRRMGALGNIAYTFMMFPVNNLFYLKNMFKEGLEALYSGDRERIKTELKVIGSHLGALMTIGGLSALPFASYIAPLVKGIFSDDDDDWEIALRKHLPAGFGRFMVRGLPAVLGNDMSGRISSDVIGMPAGLGVIRTMARRAKKAGDFLVQGEKLDALMMLMPDVIRNPYTAIVGMSEGGERSGRPPVKYTGWQAFNKALGFSPTAETEAYAAKQSMDRVKEKRSSKLEDFAEELLQLQKKKDSISISNLRKRVSAYNELQKKDDDPVIKWSSVIKSARQRDRMRNKGYLDRVSKGMKNQKRAALAAMGAG